MPYLHWNYRVAYACFVDDHSPSALEIVHKQLVNDVLGNNDSFVSGFMLCQSNGKEIDRSDESISISHSHTVSDLMQYVVENNVFVLRG